MARGWVICLAYPHRLPTYIAAMPIHSHARIQVLGNTYTKGLQQVNEQSNSQLPLESPMLPVKPTQPPTPGTT
jgi:hypothetical protein